MLRCSGNNTSKGMLISGETLVHKHRSNDLTNKLKSVSNSIEKLLISHPVDVKHSRVLLNNYKEAFIVSPHTVEFCGGTANNKTPVDAKYIYDFYGDVSNRKAGKVPADSAHTAEFYGKARHDTYFNDIEKAKSESLYAAKIIRNPKEIINFINHISNSLHGILANSKNAGDIGVKFNEYLTRVTGRNGQFGKISGGIEEINRILSDKNSLPLSFIQKVLLIKTFGAYVIDIASISPEEHSILLKGVTSEKITAAIEKYKPEALFSIRGRSAIISEEVREDIGILDKNTYKTLSDAERHFLKIDELVRKRPLFRTFINEVKNGGKVKSPFINRTFDADNPLIASISGSAACIMVGATLLYPGLNNDDKLSLSKAAIAFLVGGGYHSATEVLNVTYPELSFNKLVRSDE